MLLLKSPPRLCAFGVQTKHERDSVTQETEKTMKKRLSGNKPSDLWHGNQWEILSFIHLFLPVSEFGHVHHEKYLRWDSA